MPRNRRSRDRDEKRGEILAAARELFIAEGYAEVSVARIARRAEVTSTTVYWYFTDKDELLVAVLDDLLASSLAELESSDNSSIEQLFLLAATRLTELGSLVDAVHTRRLSSPVIDEWHDNFHGLAETITRAVLPDALDDDRVDAICRMTTFIIEGIVTHRPPDSAVREMAAAVASMVDES
ncbi:TetR/AcrR family transcriptional regulator [Williamsia deligens]|uniref:Helix-turn-helix domain-containing protein n=1 Tax=Williamsia deligens TaxID=321325 RepID=A0ABW3G975_9NOCA|nr:helix-turn-helix domain-containing protein [Williamsia deligens]MCP2192609.1 transcriptional regulator, TetR family [Williamsia deligens]